MCLVGVWQATGDEVAETRADASVSNAIRCSTLVNPELDYDSKLGVCVRSFYTLAPAISFSVTRLSHFIDSTRSVHCSVIINLKFQFMRAPASAWWDTCTHVVSIQARCGRDQQ